MKKVWIIASALFLAGCDILDKTNLSTVPGDKVWNDADYATAYINKLCRDNLPGWDTNISALSDEANGNSGTNILYGQLTASSIDEWYYENIRNINIFLENIETSEFDETKKNELKGQAFFLRAWKYFQMVRLYGGIPIIDRPQKLDDDLYVARNKTSECIEFIVSDLDKASENLPWSWTNKDIGRISKAAALAMKGRVLLFYASPQFNLNNDKARWERAYEANKIAKEEISQNGYSLYPDYEDFWFNELNSEVILAYRYEDPGISHNWDAATRPLDESENITGANQPTWEMVESYPMINGRPISDPNAGYNPTTYWENRDPRFYASIAYNGCTWELSGKTGRKQWTFVGAEIAPGATGFYCRRAINTSYDTYFAQHSSTDWVEIRYAEVLLNFAECAAELGKDGEAYDVLKQIRNRAGILSGTGDMYGLDTNMTGEQLVKAILLERKIEFAFEGKRYWDLRRRRLFASELNGKKRHGIWPILKMEKADFLEIANTVDLNKDYTKYFRDSIVELDKVFPINFKDNYYFYGIPLKHLETNSKLEQTQGWDEGTFNPYE